MWRCVEIGLALSLVLLLELCKECLFKLCLLCATYGLAKFLLFSLTELVEEVLIELAPFLLWLFVIGAVRTLVLKV